MFDNPAHLSQVVALPGNKRTGKAQTIAPHRGSLLLRGRSGLRGRASELCGVRQVATGADLHTWEGSANGTALDLSLIHISEPTRPY